MKWIFFVDLFVLIFQRWLIEVDIENECFSKKKYKKYKKEHSFSDRLYLISLRKTVKPRCLKSERRIINYPSVVTVYSILTFVMTIVWIADLAMFVITCCGLINEDDLTIPVGIVCGFCIVVFLVMYFVMKYIHYNDEKKAGR